MRPPASLTARLMMSPHTGCSRRASASGDGSSPTLRGCSKWSRTFSEYDILDRSTENLLKHGGTEEAEVSRSGDRASSGDLVIGKTARSDYPITNSSVSSFPLRCRGLNLYNPMMPENWAIQNNVPQRVVSL